MIDGTGKGATQRCEQCGREGTRGFRVLPSVLHEPTGYRTDPITLCVAEKACRHRPERQSPRRYHQDDFA